MADNIVSVSVAEAAFYQCADAIVRELTDMGWERLEAAFPTGVPVKTGYYAGSIHATPAGLHQYVIDDSGVVYGPWLEGTSPRNETTRFKGYQSFQRAAQYLQEQAEQVCQKHADALAAKLTGSG